MTNHDYNYDAIIVGAGPSGALLGALLAREGAKVAIIEKLNKKVVGIKPCGEGLIQHCLPEVHPNILPFVEIVNKSPKVHIFLADDNEEIATLKYQILMIDRHQIISELLKLAEMHGADVYYDTFVLKPIKKNNKVLGVVAKSNQQILELKSKLTVDASGFAGVLRNQLKELFIEHSLSDSEIAVGYREYSLLSDITNDTLVIFDPKDLRGGYFWIFPRGSTNNIGLGGIKKYVDPKNFPTQLNRYLEKLKIKKVNTSIPGQYGLIPARRPFSTLSSNGIILIGDAGSITNPIHGGGICTGFRSAKIAFNSIADKLESSQGILTIEDLWPYSLNVNRTEGKKHAIFELARLFLEGLPSKDLKHLAGISHKLFEETKQKIDTDLEASKLSLIFSPKLGFRLYKLKKLVKKIEQYYSEYPTTPNKIKEWNKKISKLFAFARKNFIPKSTHT